MRRSKQGPDLRKKRVSDRQQCQLGNIANGRIVSVLGELWVMSELARPALIAYPIKRAKFEGSVISRTR